MLEISEVYSDEGKEDDGLMRESSQVQMGNVILEGNKSKSREADGGSQREPKIIISFSRIFQLKSLKMLLVS